MDLEELKKDLGDLTLGDLEKIGLLKEKFQDDICLYHTTDEQNELRNEVTWVAAANTEDVNIVIITNGMLYTKEQQEETGREFEVGRVYVDEEKAAMLIDALYHAFPDVVTSQLEKILNEDEDEEDDEEISEIENISKKLDILDIPKDAHLISVDLINKAHSLNEAIGNIKQCCRTLERYKKKGYEFACSPDSNIIAISKEENLNIKNIDPDTIINIHNTIKECLGDKTKTVQNGDVTTYISFADKSYIRLLQGNIKILIDQGLQNNPIPHLKSIILDRKTIKELVSLLKTIYSKN